MIGVELLLLIAWIVTLILLLCEVRQHLFWKHACKSGDYSRWAWLVELLRN